MKKLMKIKYLLVLVAALAMVACGDDNNVNNYERNPGGRTDRSPVSGEGGSLFLSMLAPKLHTVTGGQLSASGTVTSFAVTRAENGDVTANIGGIPFTADYFIIENVSSMTGAIDLYLIADVAYSSDQGFGGYTPAGWDQVLGLAGLRRTHYAAHLTGRVVVDGAGKKLDSNSRVNIYAYEETRFSFSQVLTDFGIRIEFTYEGIPQFVGQIK